MSACQSGLQAVEELVFSHQLFFLDALVVHMLRMRCSPTIR
jgi:hypothetical protein